MAVTAVKLDNKSGSRFDLKLALSPKPKPKPRVVLYGEPGAGKTTFGCSAPSPVLIPTEDGALAVDVPKLPHDGRAQTWQDVLDACDALIEGDHDREWVVLDTLNGAAQLCADYVCKRDFDGRWEASSGKDGYNAFGRGAKATAQEFRALLSRLDALQQRRGLGVVCLAHTGLVRQGNALGADFLKFAPDLEKPLLALVVSWADQVGYAGYELRSSVRQGETKAKAQTINSERKIWWEGEAGREAKSRVGYEMPSTTLLDWAEYQRALEADPIVRLIAQTNDLLGRVAKQSADAIRERVAELSGETFGDAALRKLGKQKLETTINWLLNQVQE